MSKTKNKTLYGEQIHQLAGRGGRVICRPRLPGAVLVKETLLGRDRQWQAEQKLAKRPAAELEAERQRWAAAPWVTIAGIEYIRQIGDQPAARWSTSMSEASLRELAQRRDEDEQLQQRRATHADETNPAATAARIRQLEQQLAAATK